MLTIQIAKPSFLFLLSSLIGTQAPLEPGVRTGEELLERSLFARVAGIGELSDLRVGAVAEGEEAALLAVGSLGFAMLDPASGEVRRTVEFEPTLPPGLGTAFQRRIAADADGDGRLEFLTLAANWVGRSSLHGADGRVRWVHPPDGDRRRLSITSSHHADLDGDGRIEVLITFNASPEVHLLGHDGRLLWSRDWGRGQVGQGEVLFLDVTADQRREIVYVDGRALWTREARSGDVLFETKLPGGGYVNHLSLVHAVGGEDLLLVGEHVPQGENRGQSFWLVELDARTVRERVDWGSIELHRAAEAVEFPEHGRMYVHVEELRKQASPAGFSATRLRLRLTNAERRLVYEEVLVPPSGEKTRSKGTVCFIEAEADRPARLLVAYGDTVWAYSPRR